MARMKLTQRSVTALRTPDPSGKQQLFWDTELKGLGVLCSGTSDAKTYVIKGVVQSRSVRRKLGRTNVLSLVEARDHARAMMAGFYAGSDPRAKQAGAVSLRHATDLYLEGRPNLKPRSREAYRDAVERHFASWLDLPLRNINREMVEARHRAIAKEVSERQPHSGHAAANGAMRALRAIWNFSADRNDDLGRNPVRLNGQWHKIHPRERHLREDDLPKFYEAVRELPSAIGRDYVLMLLFTGLRRREATGLRWGDVDLQAKKIRIPSFKTKSGRALDLPMTDVVHDLLVARRSLGKTEFVFTAHSASGHLEEPRFFLDQVAAKTGIRVSAHDLRRTYLTIAESCDISPIALRALVNHSLGKDVTSGYIQMNAQRLREPAQRVTDKIKKLCGIAEG